MAYNDTVRSGATGKLIPCCWAECDRPGREQFSIRVVEARHGVPTGRTTIYLFCGSRHRLLYAQGHLAYGQLPKGLGNVDGHALIGRQAWKDGKLK